MNLKETFFPEHFSRVDRQGVVAALLLSIFFFVALLKAKPPSRIRINKTIARLETSSRNVRYKESGSVSFYEAINNEELQNKDEVFTGDNSSAIVKFLNSETIIKIPSSSLVKIEESENGESIEIKEGVVDILVKKDQAVNVKINGVDHKISSTTEKESVVKAYYSAGELHLFTKSAGIKIKNDVGVKDLKSNTDAIMADSSAKIIPSFLLLLPAPGDKIEPTEGIKIVTNLKSKYEVIFSKNADLSHPQQTAHFEGTSFVFNANFTEGDYFLGVVDKNASRIVPVTLTSRFKIFGLFPEDGTFINLTPGDKASLRWNPLPVPSYKVTVHDNNKKEKSFIVKNNNFDIENVKGSHFEWSIAPELTNGKYADATNLNKIGLHFKGKVELINVPESNKFRIGNDKNILTWKSFPGETFLINVLDIKANKIINSKQSVSASFNIPTETSGSRKIEISSLDYPGVEMATFNYDVSLPLLVWDAKLPKEIKTPDEVSEVSLKYKSNFEQTQKLSLHINFSPALGSSSTKDIELDSSDRLKVEGFGQYCLKAFLGKPVEFLEESDNYCFKLIKIPPFPSLP
ncbi:MAG: hypothetical protein Q7U04_00590, partial [Bacteriovorax sp.]|nr:hypothetical protein [Bacteriovorax sp.]